MTVTAYRIAANTPADLDAALKKLGIDDDEIINILEFQTLQRPKIEGGEPIVQTILRVYVRHAEPQFVWTRLPDGIWKSFGPVKSPARVDAFLQGLRAVNDNPLLEVQVLPVGKMPEA